MDFFAVPTIMFKVLFVFVVLAHNRRRVVHMNVTDAPTAQWTAQQLVEAFPWETAPRYLLRDRDAVYGVEFEPSPSHGNREVKTAPRAPWQNPYVERLIGTLRRECLDHIVVLNDAHLRRLLRDYSSTTTAARTHLSLEQGRPGAKRGGAPRSRPDRRDTHGRRPPSSLYPPGGVRSVGPAGVPPREAAGRPVTAVHLGLPTPCV